MVRYLVDTNILIDFLRNRSRETDILNKISKDDIAISVISYGEVMEGVLETKKSEIVRKFLNEFFHLSIETTTSEIFAKLRYKLRKQGNLIDNMDLLIAATALEHDLIIITNNKKDFQRIQSLKML